MRWIVVAVGLALIVAAVVSLWDQKEETSQAAVSSEGRERVSVPITFETDEKPKPKVSLPPAAERKGIQQDKIDEKTANVLLEEYGEIESPRYAPKHPSRMLGGASVVWEPPVPPPPGTGRFGLPPD